MKNSMKTTKALPLIWVLILFLVTFTCLLTYLTTQQMLRLGANESPAQIAEHTAVLLNNGQSTSQVISSHPVEISKSLDPFVMVFNKNKQLVVSSAVLNRQNPNYPTGVLDIVKKKGEDRVTWQSLGGYRFATVAIPYKNGYIVGGQSLNETEMLIDKIGRLILYAWLASLVCTTLTLLIINAVLKRYQYWSMRKA